MQVVASAVLGSSIITHSHLCCLRVHVVSGSALACVNDMFINTTMKIRFKMAVSGVGGHEYSEVVVS